MTTKDKVIQAVQDLPDDASIGDAMERLLLLVKIDRGVQQADAGQTISHTLIRERMFIERFNQGKSNEHE